MWNGTQMRGAHNGASFEDTSVKVRMEYEVRRSGHRPSELGVDRRDGGDGVSITPE